MHTLIFRDGGFTVAYCDAGATAVWDRTNGVQSSTHKDPLGLTTKEYILDVKPLFSAFQPKNLAMTSLRSFLLFYLPLLEPRTPAEEEDNAEAPVEPDKPVDLVTPFQNSIKQILREVSSVNYIHIFVFFISLFYIIWKWNYWVAWYAMLKTLKTAEADMIFRFCLFFTMKPKTEFESFINVVFHQLTHNKCNSIPAHLICSPLCLNSAVEF